MLDSAFLFLSLVAGASADNTPSLGGAFTFAVAGLLSSSDWPLGSEYDFDMLIAGASAFDTPAIGGALAFTVADTPSWANWGIGSAIYR